MLLQYKRSKTNSTNGDYSYNLDFYTRKFGSAIEKRMTIDNDGNVGIGTDLPNIGSDGGTAILTLKNTGTSRAVLNMTSTTPGTGVYAQEAFYNGGVLKTLVQHVGDGSTDSGYIKWFTTASGGSTTERMRIRSGGGIINHYRTGINVGQSATAITSASTYGGMAMIWQNYVGNIGYDLVTWTLSQVTVLASQSISGGAAARSYTAVSGVLKLTMGASDTYQVYVSDITNSTG